MHDVTLALHVAAGVVGLVAGPLAGLAPKRRGRHTVSGWTYQWSVAVLCTTALVLVALDPTLWPFALIAVATAGAAAGGVVVRRRRRPGWVVLHVQLVLGSYVSFVTAFTMQLVDGVLGWLLPVVVGSTVVSVVTARVARRQAARPRPAVAVR